MAEQLPPPPPLLLLEPLPPPESRDLTNELAAFSPAVTMASADLAPADKE